MSVRSLMASGPRCLRCRYVMPSGPAELEFGVGGCEVWWVVRAQFLFALMSACYSVRVVFGEA